MFLIHFIEKILIKKYKIEITQYNYKPQKKIKIYIHAIVIEILQCLCICSNAYELSSVSFDNAYCSKQH